MGPPSPEESDSCHTLKVDVFRMGEDYVLLAQLSKLWNYPSSYQIIKRIIQKSHTPKEAFLHETDGDLNEQLLAHGVISEEDKQYKLFYVSVKFLLLIIRNKEVIIDDGSDKEPEESERVQISEDADDENIITVGQVFPQSMTDYSSLFNHSTFSSLTKLTKYNFYKMTPAYHRFLPPSKLFLEERELLNKEYDLGSLEFHENSKQPSEVKKKKKGRKPLGKTKKSNINIDPNSIELEESIVPGQGFVQEFNVNHFCKVPNYFVTTNNPNIAASFTVSKKSSSSSLPSTSSLFGDSSRLSKNVQLLVSSNDNDTYSHPKYFYFKSYRGPGSGNYKDAGLIYKINKVPVAKRLTIKLNHKNINEVMKTSRKRYNLNVKGLMYDKFDESFVDRTLKRQNTHAEDFENIEMLHNNLQFNLLLNTYRDIGNTIWSNYYEFKMIDFDRLAVEKKLKFLHSKIGLNSELVPNALASVYASTANLLERFTLPSTYPEIIQQLPLELRDEESIKTPLYFCTTYPDSDNPQLLNKVEIVKIPNSNSIGWDNMKKYRRQ